MGVNFFRLQNKLLFFVVVLVTKSYYTNVFSMDYNNYYFSLKNNTEIVSLTVDKDKNNCTGIDGIFNKVLTNIVEGCTYVTYFTDFLGITYKFCAHKNSITHKNSVTRKNSITRIVVLKHIFIHSFFRGIFSTKRCNILNKSTWIKLYFAIGNVPYIGGIFNFSLVWKYSWLDYLHKMYLPSFIKEVTIRIIGFRLFAYLLLRGFDYLLTKNQLTSTCKEVGESYIESSNQLPQVRATYIYPYVLDFLTIDFKIYGMYNISLNIGNLFISYNFGNLLQKDTGTIDIKEETDESEEK